jgi:cellobiose-specific phosphotransferase system component IIA
LYNRTRRHNGYIYVKYMMTLMAQTFEISIAMVLLFGISGLVITNVGPIAFAQEETANKQIDEAMKALNSGDDAEAEGAMQEANNTLPEGQAKFHLGEAMKALQAGNSTGAMTHLQAAQNNL